MITDFIHARDEAARKNQWVVVIVPPERLDEGLSSLAAVANGHPCGGRTVVLGGGRLSVMASSEPVFEPPAGQSFRVMFVGWGRTRTPHGEEMSRWRQAASSLVSRSA
jgi:hypothetical protein